MFLREKRPSPFPFATQKTTQRPHLLSHLARRRVDGVVDFLGARGVLQSSDRSLAECDVFCGLVLCFIGIFFVFLLGFVCMFDRFCMFFGHFYVFVAWFCVFCCWFYSYEAPSVFHRLVPSLSTKKPVADASLAAPFPVALPGDLCLEETFFQGSMWFFQRKTFKELENLTKPLESSMLSRSCK